jgi:hypothetical protein
MLDIPTMQVIQVSSMDVDMQRKLTSNADVITHRLESELQSLNTRVLHDPLPIRLDPKTAAQIPKTFEQTCAVSDDDSLKSVIIAYIGGESLNLTNLLITHSHCEVNHHNCYLILAFYDFLGVCVRPIHEIRSLAIA